MAAVHSGQARTSRPDSATSWVAALGDVDADGDLDVAIANWGGTDRLYLNDGTGTFDEGQNIGTSASTAGVALGDVDADGDIDFVAAIYFGANRLNTNEVVSPSASFDTTRTVLTSPSTVSPGNVHAATLTTSATLPAHTSIDWWISNDGGATWRKTVPGQLRAFAATGTDVRWRAELHSLSPAVTPTVHSVAIAVHNVIPELPTNASVSFDGASAVVSWTPPVDTGGSALVEATVTLVGGSTVSVPAPDKSVSFAGLDRYQSHEFHDHCLQQRGHIGIGRSGVGGALTASARANPRDLCVADHVDGRDHRCR